MDDPGSLSVLVVESEVSMRDNLRAMLARHGLADVHLTPNAGTACRKLRERSFDIILCEYFLGDGQDGQHLLEDLRSHNLIPLSTVFIMVTAESGYERVVGAAELAPSDYVLKPFTADTLFERINRAVQRREAFLPAYKLMEMGNLHGAISYCRSAEKQFAAHAVDFMRLRAELHIAAGEPDEAQRVYAKVLESRAIPWARLGLAKALYMQKRFEDSEDTLQQLITDSKHYLDAYDWLAKVKEASGRLKDAQKVIENAVSVSPFVVRRLKKLGEVAMETGDLTAAEKALSEVVRKSKYSDFRDPEDHVKLITALVRKGDTEQAQKVVRELDRSMNGVKKTEACRAISSALLLSRAGEKQKAVDSLSKAVHACTEDVGLSSTIKIELARSCLENQLDDAATRLIGDIMRNTSDGSDLEKAKAVLAGAGKAALAEELATRTRDDVVKLIAEGAAKAQEGNFEESVALMTQAARKMPGNTDVLLNAALAVLKYLDHRGWNDKLAAQACRYLDTGRQQNPAHPRIAPLSTYYYNLLKKYGIQPGKVA